MELAWDIFAGTSIQISSADLPHLGAATGSAQFMQEYAAQPVGKWVEGLNHLVSFAQTQPYVHLSIAFIHHPLLSLIFYSNR